MGQILENIRIIDIGRYVAGPYCATLLGGLGAEIISVERPQGGEDRFISPLFHHADGSPGEGGLFMQTASGKKSLTLDLSQAKGREILHKLTQSADIIIANLPPKALAKLELDWASLSQRHPSCILVTQTGFGTTGPDSHKGGFDGLGQALSGATYLTGTPEQPAKAAAPYVDYSTATLSAFATLAALMHRQHSGKGQHVETSLLGTALSVMSAHLTEQAVTQKNRIGTANRVQTSAPSDIFKTKDGHILVHIVGHNLFRRWAKLVGRAELGDDAAYADDQKRGDARDILCGIMQAWCADKSSQQALAALEEAGLPSAPILDLQQALDNPQAHAMSFFRSIQFPQLDQPIQSADMPMRFSAMDAQFTGRPPLIGEHNNEILRELGYSDEMIDALRQENVI